MHDGVIFGGDKMSAASRRDVGQRAEPSRTKREKERRKMEAKCKVSELETYEAHSSIQLLYLRHLPLLLRRIP